jgi:hypothetical protein
MDFSNEREWRKYQFQKFNSIDSKLESIDVRIGKIEINEAVSKYKFYLIGIFFGGIGSLFMSIIIAMVNK